MLHQRTDPLSSTCKTSKNSDVKYPVNNTNSTDSGSQSSPRNRKGSPQIEETDNNESVVETEIANKDPLPEHILHDVEHYRQRYQWDCGVSCVLMLLSPDQRTHFLNHFEKICAEEGFQSSTWTIDLCYLLKRFGINHKMHTTLMGVNEDHQKHSYYQRCMRLDRARVKERFKEAESNGIKIQETSVSSKSIQRHLAEHGPVILLVDSGLLVCDLCKHNKLKHEFRRCFGGAYTGHYILVVGYKASGQGLGGGKVLYHDPGLNSRLCAISFSRLSKARSAPGTDNDVIFIYDYCK